jgi:hypothetical protein
MRLLTQLGGGMSAVSYDGPFTIVSGMLPGETDREAKQLLAKGYTEIHATRKEDLAPLQFFRIKTRSGTRAEEQWTITRRNS